MAKKSPEAVLFRQVPSILKELDQIPLMGHPPLFPFDDILAQLQKTLEREDLLIEVSEWKLIEEKDLFSGLGDKLLPLLFTASPIEGHFTWVMAEQELSKLLALLLMHESHPFKQIDEAFEEGFYEFLALEVLHSITTSGFDSSTSFQLLTQKELPDQPCLSADVTITLQDQKILGRLFLPNDFLNNWREHYRKRAQPDLTEFSKNFDVSVALVTANSELKQETWKKANVGDLIVLEHCSIDIEKDEGDVILAVDNHPILHGSLKEGNITIAKSPATKREK